MSSIGGVQTNRISTLTDTSISATDAAQIAQLAQTNVLAGMSQASAATTAELKVGLQDLMAMSTAMENLDPSAPVGTVISRSAGEAQDLAAFMNAHPAVWKPGDGGIVFKDAQGQPVTDLTSGSIASVEVAPAGAKTLAQVKDDGSHALMDKMQNVMQQTVLVDAMDQRTRQATATILGNIR